MAITIVIRKVSLKVAGRREGDSTLESDMEGENAPMEVNCPLSNVPEYEYSRALSVAGWGMFLPAATGWGRLHIKMGKLVKSERRHSFRHRPSFMGPFRYPHRAMIPISDGRAWHHRQLSQGGTVLVDKSGSMCISEGEVLDFLHKRPLATVAIYEGSHGNSAGTLTIIAQSNKYAVMIPELDGGNVVDGPALKWLARQQKPRVWVCDGGLTGIGDNSANQSMLLEAAVTIKRGDIKQVRLLSRALKVV